MQRILLILAVFFMMSAAAAQADTPPSGMDDMALSSYISGRLSAVLKDQSHQAAQSCDSSGCAVVVQ